MDLREKFDYWLDIAQYDLDTAEAMFISGRWLYVVFMCQQAIEKLCKGLYLLFAKLSAFYLNNRYPKYKERLSVSINSEEAQNILEQTREVFTWLQTLKP